jgi:hypothetical protein
MTVTQFNPPPPSRFAVEQRYPLASTPWVPFRLIAEDVVFLDALKERDRLAAKFPGHDFRLV